MVFTGVTGLRGELTGLSREHERASEPLCVFPLIERSFIVGHLATKDDPVTLAVCPKHRKQKAVIYRFTEIKIASLRRVLVCLGEESDGKRILKDLFNLPRGDLFEVKMAVNPVKVHDRVERGSLMKKVRRRRNAS